MAKIEQLEMILEDQEHDTVGNEFKRQVLGKREDPVDLFQTAAGRVKVVLRAQVCGRIT